ncbi:MAG: 16S rRNA (uracil(1498)-N(3))-methyltransferase [Gammaproteobacteria bacterium]
MSIPRIYLPVALQTTASVPLAKQAAQHITRVLRMKPGAALIVFNGQGGEYAATLESEQRGMATIKIGDSIARDAESKLSVQLAQGISRGERMDYAIQKAVELGVAQIVPLFTEFCVVNMKEERAEKRLAHWQGIAISACEQCGRTRVPEILAPRPLHEWLAQTQANLKLVFDPYSTQHLSQLEPPTGDISMLIGPEGGLSDAETQAAIKSGFTAVQLGPRMLRTETAPVAALAAVQTLWGDFG